MATQVAGEMYYELDGQLGEIKRQLRQPNGYPFSLEQLKIALQNAIEGKFPELPIVEPQKQSPFSVTATTNLVALGEKKTAACFPKSRYIHRDGDFDNRLPATQPKADTCTISTLAFTKDWTFAEAAAKVLGIGAGTSIKLLGKALIENGHTMKSLAQAEIMVEKTERGDETGMRTDGYANFFFAETGNEDNPVSVGYVSRGGRDWSADVSSLGSGRRWSTGSRLLVRNLSDTSKL